MRQILAVLPVVMAGSLVLCVDSATAQYSRTGQGSMRGSYGVQAGTSMQGYSGGSGVAYRYGSGGGGYSDYGSSSGSYGPSRYHYGSGTPGYSGYGSSGYRYRVPSRSGTYFPGYYSLYNNPGIGTMYSY